MFWRMVRAVHPRRAIKFMRSRMGLASLTASLSAPFSTALHLEITFAMGVSLFPAL
jgi:hypothetical protein